MDESAEFRQSENWLKPGQYAHPLSFSRTRSKSRTSFDVTDRGLKGEQ
jgi:hypothetical protein